MSGKVYVPIRKGYMSRNQPRNYKEKELSCNLIIQSLTRKKKEKKKKKKKKSVHSRLPITGNI